MLKKKRKYEKPKIKYERRIETFAVVCSGDPQSKNYYSQMNRFRAPCRRIFS